jgi:hypothetical protein
LTSHSEHKSLVISASRRGPMLYIFCRDDSCRHRIAKSPEVTVSGSSLEKDFVGVECSHPKVVLNRTKHFNIAAKCLSCNQTVLTKNVYVESKDVFSPKVNWSKVSNLGDSMLPKGDPRLLSASHE